MYYGTYFESEVEMGRACSTNGGEEDRILVGKPEGNRPLGRPRRRWVGYIGMDLGEIEWDGVEWIDVAQDMDQWRALVNTAVKCWEVLEWLHNLRLLRE
jgi:hypothetical protein